MDMGKETFNRLKKEMNYYGISYFLHLKATEISYRFKTGNLELNCLDGCSRIEKTRSHSVNGDSMKNESTAFYQIKKGLRVTGLSYSSVSMLDFGCGYGKQLIFGMLNGFKKVAGIDIDGLAVAMAKSNCRRMQTKGYETLFNIRQADVCEFEIPQGVNVVFMANPFGRKTMEVVIEKLIRYSKTVDRPLFVLYAVPVYKDVLEKYAVCKKIYEKPAVRNGTPVLAVYKIMQCSHLPFVNKSQMVSQCV
jgi:predicted RNA methylase